MTERSRRVVVTGAGGLIGRTIAPLLPSGWDLLRTDLRAGDSIAAPRDAAELVRAAVEAENVDFVVANGTSANRYRRADVQDTIQRLGYRPTDDAW
jgi:NAD(P)-dependent dehydrogenase (short-subunit alcohol dehydrogenase family)